MQITGKDKVFFGREKSTGAAIYITKPSFDCDWYWSFGYLGNRNCHYHLSGYKNGRNICMHDALLEDYDLAEHIKDDLWSFCEQAKTIYTLIEAAKVFHIGGAHQSKNPCADIIKAHSHDNEINEKLLPILLQKFWDEFGYSV